MKPGQWSLRFSQDTPKSVLDKLNWQVTATAGFGHVCIFPTRLNPKLYSTAQLLSLSRYTGVPVRWGGCWLRRGSGSTGSSPRGTHGCCWW